MARCKTCGHPKGNHSGKSGVCRVMTDLDACTYCLCTGYRDRKPKPRRSAEEWAREGCRAKGCPFRYGSARKCAIEKGCPWYAVTLSLTRRILRSERGGKR